MSYMNKVCVAASVAVMNSHVSDQGLKSLNHAKNRLFSAADLRPLCGGMLTSQLGGLLGAAVGAGVDKTKQADESIRQVMYLNCWGQS